MRPSRSRRFLVRGFASVAIVAGSVMPAVADPLPAIWNGNTSGAWATGSNWDTGTAPTGGYNAYLPQSPAPGTKSITLGSGAAANYLFVEDLGYSISGGDLTLSNQLWIQQTTGAALTVTASGTLTAPNATLGADAGKSGQLVVDSAGGTASATVTGLLQIGADGGNSGLAVIGGTNPATVTAGQLWVGVNSGSNGVAVSSGGTLAVTGSDDFAIGTGASAQDNHVTITDVGSSFSVVKNVVVGVGGSSNSFVVTNGATATSGGARVGVDAGSADNVVGVGGGASWTMNGSVRVGDAGSNNVFLVVSGTATLTGAGKNFYVGYANSASNNALAVVGPGSKVVVRDATADLVVSANQTTGANATGNMIGVASGGIIDATRTIIGNGGTLAGYDGTVKSNVLVGTGGSVAPGDGTDGTIGALAIDGNLDLAPSVFPFTGQIGRLDIDINGSQIDQISVTGLLNVAGSTLHFDSSNWDHQTHVFATYGTLTGTFGSIEGLPQFSYIDYAFGGLNQIALVAVPEIDAASLGSALALVAGALGMLERRRKRA